MTPSEVVTRFVLIPVMDMPIGPNPRTPTPCGSEVPAGA